MNKKRYQNLFSSLGRRIVLALSLALGLFFAPNTQAQIKQSKAPIERTLLGCTLGVSTPKQVVEIVQKLGGEIIQNYYSPQPARYTVTYIATGLMYEGSATRRVLFQFYRGQLVFVSLTFVEQQELNRIERLLVGKYGVMGKSQDTSPIVMMKQIQDAHTGLWITKNYTARSHQVFKDGTIDYADRALSQAQRAESAGDT
jgi:hypothetical protein